MHAAAAAEVARELRGTHVALSEDDAVGPPLLDPAPHRRQKVESLCGRLVEHQGHGVEPEARHSEAHPVVNDPRELLPDLRVRQVQVGLEVEERVIVVQPGRLVEGPGAGLAHDVHVAQRLVRSSVEAAV